MSGYLHLPAETREAFTADGFLRTGDIGVLRPDGNLTLVGRSNDMFKLLPVGKVDKQALATETTAP